jgi:hypothetical protein
MKAEEVLEKQGFKIMCHQKDDDVLHDVFVKPLIQAMEEYASIKQDELIEKAAREYYRSSYIMKDEKERTVHIDEFKNWLKSKLI